MSKLKLTPQNSTVLGWKTCPRCKGDGVVYHGGPGKRCCSGRVPVAPKWKPGERVLVEGVMPAVVKWTAGGVVYVQTNRWPNISAASPVMLVKAPK